MTIRDEPAGPDAPVSAQTGIELRDGTTVELHPMLADDAASLLRFHASLSRDTTYLRFFTIHPELSAKELQRFTHVDHRTREAIVATVAGEIVAIARFDCLDDPRDAEVAFVVADSWQGRGLGAALFDRLAQRARELGVARFVAETLPHNSRMLAVFHHAGLPATSSISDGVVHIVVDLGVGERATLACVSRRAQRLEARTVVPAAPRRMSAASCRAPIAPR